MAIRKHSMKPAKDRMIAKERIEKLFIEAENSFKERKDLSNRYVALARKIGMKYKVSLRSELKRRFCKFCYAYLQPGANCTVRLAGKHLVYHCAECKKMMRFPYKKKNVNNQARI